MARPYTEHDLEEAYARGVAHTEERLLPFDHVADVYFEPDRPHPEAVIAYEQRLVAKLASTDSFTDWALMMRDHSGEDELRVAQHGRDHVAAPGGSNRVSRAVRRGAAWHKAGGQLRDARKRSAEDNGRVHGLEDLQARLRGEISAARRWLENQAAHLDHYRTKPD